MVDEIKEEFRNLISTETQKISPVYDDKFFGKEVSATTTDIKNHFEKLINDSTTVGQVLEYISTVKKYVETEIMLANMYKPFKDFGNTFSIEGNKKLNELQLKNIKYNKQKLIEYRNNALDILKKRNEFSEWLKEPNHNFYSKTNGYVEKMKNFTNQIKEAYQLKVEATKSIFLIGIDDNKGLKQKYTEQQIIDALQNNNSKPKELTSKIVDDALFGRLFDKKIHNVFLKKKGGIIDYTSPSGFTTVEFLGKIEKRNGINKLVLYVAYKFNNKVKGDFSITFTNHSKQQSYIEFKK
ncbi:hypothetical protein ACT1UH_00455 [Mycoplasma sp. 332]|uniref:hypothetical protein n=1 Tax=Mycoplasma sp. 332 TaxID=3458236 RepID=UPI004035873C